MSISGCAKGAASLIGGPENSAASARFPRVTRSGEVGAPVGKHQGAAGSSNESKHTVEIDAGHLDRAKKRRDAGKGVGQNAGGVARYELGHLRDRHRDRPVGGGGCETCTVDDKKI